MPEFSYLSTFRNVILSDMVRKLGSRRYLGGDQRSINSTPKVATGDSDSHDCTYTIYPIGDQREHLVYLLVLPYIKVILADSTRKGVESVSEPNKFQLTFIKQEQHLMLPRTSSILLTQNLYDILFQYVITPEKEEKLNYFINLLETHIKSKALAPFSMPLSELEFLDEGLEEMRLLNWAELPVSVFQISLDACLNKNAYDDEIDNACNLLESLMIVRRYQGSDLVYVYPSNLVRY